MRRRALNARSGRAAPVHSRKQDRHSACRAGHRCHDTLRYVKRHRMAVKYRRMESRQRGNTAEDQALWEMETVPLTSTTRFDRRGLSLNPSQQAMGTVPEKTTDSLGVPRLWILMDTDNKPWRFDKQRSTSSEMFGGCRFSHETAIWHTSKDQPPNRLRTREVKREQCPVTDLYVQVLWHVWCRRKSFRDLLQRDTIDNRRAIFVGRILKSRIAHALECNTVIASRRYLEDKRMLNKVRAGHRRPTNDVGFRIVAVRMHSRPQGIESVPRIVRTDTGMKSKTIETFRRKADSLVGATLVLQLQIARTLIY